MFTLIRSDPDCILQQIRIDERHAAGGDLPTLVGSGAVSPGTKLLPYGLRTVDGTFDDLVTGQTSFGAADRSFPRLLAPNPADAGSSCTQLTGIVVDTQPCAISNLIVDQTRANPAAAANTPAPTSSAAGAPDRGRPRAGPNSRTKRYSGTMRCCRS